MAYGFKCFRHAGGGIMCRKKPGSNLSCYCITAYEPVLNYITFYNIISYDNKIRRGEGARKNSIDIIPDVDILKSLYNPFGNPASTR